MESLNSIKTELKHVQDIKEPLKFSSQQPLFINRSMVDMG